MAILVILMAAALPSFNAWYGDSVVRGAGDEIRRAWAEARARSIDNGVPYRYCEKSGTGDYRIAPDSDEFWNGTADGADAKAMTGSLPTGIKFKATAGTVAAAIGVRLSFFFPTGPPRTMRKPN